ncbi:MAG: deoxyribodipyrimidine photo-lyase [Anaerolineae bacterium]|jgi:deoxyribodipyrimidine photo-lyase|nr:deoxyribodipyrimidine photo-lyase [Anaerolineae bacterium]
MSADMQREFANREALIAYLAQQFPQAAAAADEVPPVPGGRRAAEARLKQITPGKAYSASRNYLNGAVSRLSPYLRHGVLSLAEVRDAALEQAADPAEVEKFINELAWRDYWQRVYRAMGDGIWEDVEAYKTGYAAAEYAADLPEDVAAGRTGLACMDAFSRDLRETGYLHNHARMWLAAYLIHWRRVRWQAGARWFLTHLLDGDPASNNLSWQWVGSTFSSKPYYFNREALEKFTDGRYCRACPLYRTQRCPFEGSYEALAERLFPYAEVAAEAAPPPRKKR